MKKIALLSFSTLMTLNGAFAVTSVADLKAIIAEAPAKQVLEYGLRGIGGCKLVYTRQRGLQTLRLITPKKTGYLVGGSIFAVPISSTKNLEHGIVYRSEFASVLAEPARVFPAAVYGAYMQADYEANAVAMLRTAVANNGCNITSADLPKSQGVIMSNLSSADIKAKFTFYSDASKNLKCSSTAHGIPWFNPQTCAYETKPVLLGDGFCKKAYQSAARDGRATVTNKGGTAGPKLPAVSLAPLSAELLSELQVASLPIKDFALAEASLVKQDFAALVDISYALVDKDLIATSPDHAERAAKYVAYLDSIDKSDVTIEADYNAIYTAVKNKPALAPYSGVATATLTAAPAISMATLQPALEAAVLPFKPLTKKFNLANVGCAMQLQAAPAQKANAAF